MRIIVSLALACSALTGCREAAQKPPSSMAEAAAFPESAEAGAGAAAPAPPPPPSLGNAQPFTPERVTVEGRAMGTHLAFAGYTTPKLDAVSLRKAFDAAVKEFERLETLMTTWREEAQLAKVNAAAGNTPYALAMAAKNEKYATYDGYNYGAVARRIDAAAGSGGTDRMLAAAAATEANKPYTAEGQEALRLQLVLDLQKQAAAEERQATAAAAKHECQQPGHCAATRHLHHAAISLRIFRRRAPYPAILPAARPATAPVRGGCSGLSAGRPPGWPATRLISPRAPDSSCGRSPA